MFSVKLSDVTPLPLAPPLPVPDSGTLWGWAASGLAAFIVWIITLATTRQRLIDHLRECDRRHIDNQKALEALREGQLEMLRYLRGPARERGH